MLNNFNFTAKNVSTEQPDIYRELVKINHHFPDKP